jgi:hypothetical protein
MSDMGLMARFWPQVPRLLGHGVPLVGVAGIAAYNGSLHSLVFESVSYSPVFDSVSYYVSTFARGSYFDSFVTGVLLAGPQFYQDVTSVFIAAMTLLVAGIPAAIYERIRGLKASTPVSLGIWLAATVLLTLPTIIKALSDDF